MKTNTNKDHPLQYRNSLIIALTLFLAFSLGVSTYAQKHRHRDLSKQPPAIDYFNIFCASYTTVGVPVNDKVYLYRPPLKSDTLSGWKCYDSTKIPAGTIGIDGNIRKTIFLTDKAIYYEEGETRDTLRFNSRLKKVNPSVWIRGVYNTEKDIAYLSAEKRITYYADGGDWFVSDQLSPYFYEQNRTYPLLTDKDKFLKLYDQQTHYTRSIVAVYLHKITFHDYQLTAMLNPVDVAALTSRTFQLPEESLSAFIYDYYAIGVCFANKIVFYSYKPDLKNWVPSESIPPLLLPLTNKKR